MLEIIPRLGCDAVPGYVPLILFVGFFLTLAATFLTPDGNELGAAREAHDRPKETAAFAGPDCVRDLVSTERCPP